VDVVTAAVFAALAGAWCYAVSAALQHLDADRSTDDRLIHPRLLWNLAHRPRWLAAVTASGLGAALHVFALSRGSLSLVQPLGVTGPVFAVPLAAALRRHRVQRGEVVGSVLVVLGLGALLVAFHSRTAAGVGSAGWASMLAVLVVPGLLIAVAARAARVVPDRVRSMVLAGSAGVSFGTASVLVRMAVGANSRSEAIAMLVLAVGGIAVFASLGLLLTRAAYRVGGFAAALACITVIDPAVAVVAGVVLLHEPHPTSPGPIVAAAAAAAVIVLGIALLVRSPAHQNSSSLNDAGPDPATRRAGMCPAGRSEAPAVNPFSEAAHR